MTTANKPFIAVNTTPAMSGHFATLYAWTQEEDYGFYEPYESGFGRYADWQDAEREAAQWAEEMGVEHRPITQEDVDRAKAYAANSAARIERIRELKSQGLELRDIMKQVREEFGEP